MSKDIETVKDILTELANSVVSNTQDLVAQQDKSVDEMNQEDVSDALKSIQKIIKERVIGVNYKKVKQPVRFSTADSGYCRNTRWGRTCTDRQTALRENNVRNKQRQALKNALYGKGDDR